MIYFYNQLFSNIILVVKYVNCQVTLLMFSFIFLLFRLCRDGSAEPRPKNSPLDCFCLTLFGTSFSNPSFPKHKNKSIAYAMDSFLWWAEMDSNHRSKLQQIYSLSPLATRESAHNTKSIWNCIKPMIGLEPITCWLQISCSANWATSANIMPWQVRHRGLEPRTPWLRVRCSTKWASGAYSDSNGNRTRVTAVKGRCLNRLTMEPY